MEGSIASGLPQARARADETRVRRRHAPEYKITVASKLDNLAKIAAFVDDVGTRLSLPRDFLFDVQVAIGEACTNIIQHAYDMRPDRPITIGCRLRNREFIVRIRDFGQPCNPDAANVPVIDVDLKERRLNGLGVFLMKKMVNRFKCRANGHRGNETMLVKKLPEVPEKDPGPLTQDRAP